MCKSKVWNKRGIALLLGAALLLSACGSDASASAMRLMRSQGQVDVSDDAGAEVELLENLTLYSGYEVDTRQESFAWINLDNVKLTKMDQESVIIIQKDGKKLEIEVKSGSLFFHVTEPLEDDETMDIRTSNMTVGIRGTCGWVAEDAVALLEGTVAVTAGEQTVTVSAGEMAVMSPDGTLEVKKLSAKDIPAFVQEEIADSEELAEAVQAINGGGISAESDFVPWAEAGLEDHVMDWKDEALAAAMAEETGITDREIMLSDVWEMRSFQPANHAVAIAEDISDISALGELTNLTGVAINADNISDISVLASLTNLTSLRLSSSNISDISALAGLTKLYYLSLDNCNISDISPLAGLTNLDDYLSLIGNNISDISALAGLTDVATLRLSRNNISDISALAGLTKLTTLEMNKNNISDISALAEITSLTHLDLSDNNISDISALADLTKLIRLRLGENHISDISVLSGMESLSDLGLRYNEISDVSSLGSLTSLHMLNLGDNNISDVSALANLTNLADLYLKGNAISDYSPVEFVNNLTK